MKCCKCRSEPPPGALFCPACGSVLPEGSTGSAMDTTPTLEQVVSSSDAVAVALSTLPTQNQALDTGTRTLPTAGPADPRVTRRWRTGDKPLGRYRILSELGQGGMGVVYKCHDEVGGIEVAFKALPPELSHNSLEMDEIRENFRLIEKLHHPNIAAVKTLERDPETGDYYLILELVDGVSLHRWRKDKGGKVALQHILPVVRQVADALDYAHSRKVIHQDIKPANVMLGADGTVKVLDFGLGAQVRTSLSRVSRVHHSTCGTGPYMAPEQWRGQYQDGASNQYALATMTYELLAGRVPFDASDTLVLKHAILDENPLEVEGLADRAREALTRGLAKARAERFESCGSFVDALESVVTTVFTGQEGDLVMSAQRHPSTATTMRFHDKCMLTLGLALLILMTIFTLVQIKK